MDDVPAEIRATLKCAVVVVAVKIARKSDELSAWLNMSTPPAEVPMLITDGVPSLLAVTTYDFPIVVGNYADIVGNPVVKTRSIHLPAFQ